MYCRIPQYSVFHCVLFQGCYSSGPVSLAARSKARVVLDPSNTGVVGSNPVRGMGLCPRLSVLCCPV
jgi:hypothetical protein